MATSRLSVKGQLVIPKEIREHLGLRPGDRLAFVILDDGEVVIRPAVVDVRDLKGIVERPGRKSVSIRAMNEAIRRRAGGRS
ncbi:MAG: AbrB/MazE/SpoVT family DNA-binding domain-containing protein [Planctomycetota bacterium]